MAEIILLIGLTFRQLYGGDSGKNGLDDRGLRERQVGMYHYSINLINKGVQFNSTLERAQYQGNATRTIP